jgi:RNA 3'-terminal phosphate cyclase (ATP)
LVQIIDMMIEIPGTHLEGGGQLVRVAVSLATLTKTPVHISKIRGNRPAGGGLKTQHLRAVEWLGEASNALMEGAHKGSKDLVFQPGVIEKSVSVTSKKSLNQGAEDGRVRNIKIDIGSPGSIGLVLQAVLPYILFSAESAHPLPVKLAISGGTNVSFSPSYDYMHHVLVPTLSRTGLPPIGVRLGKRGWTHGGSNIGSIIFTLLPLPLNTTLPAFTFENRGEIQKLSLVILAPGGNGRQQLKEATIRHLDHVFPGVEIDIATNSESGSPKRFYLLVVAHTSNGFRLGRDWLYDRKIKDPDAVSMQLAERVVGELELEMRHGGCVDEYMQDQLVVFQSLAHGKSVVNRGQHILVEEERQEESQVGVIREPSLHTRTARWVAETILGIKFDAEGNCEGRGLMVGHSTSAHISTNFKEGRECQDD